MVYLKLKHPSGKITFKKFKGMGLSNKKIRMKYYGTAHHFNTEAAVIGISKRKRR